MSKGVFGVRLVIRQNDASLYGIARTARMTRYLSGKVELPGGFKSKAVLKQALALEVKNIFDGT